MATGYREVAAPVVSLEASLAVASERQGSLHQYVHACPRRTYLCVGVKLLDDLLSPAFEVSSLRVQAAVQVHAAQVVFRREYEADAMVVVLSMGAHGFLIASPGLGVGAVGSPPRERTVWHFGWLAVALLGTPAQPLLKVLYVLRVRYHDESFEVWGGREALPVSHLPQNGKFEKSVPSPVSLSESVIWVVSSGGTGPTVPNSTLLRLPVRVWVTWATNCLPTRLFRSTPGCLWKSLPRHASKMVQALEPCLMFPVSSSRLA